MGCTKVIFFDLSGTVHTDSVGIPGVVDALESLRRNCPHVQIKFISNTTKTSSKLLLRQLHSIGLNFISQKDLRTSLSATKEHLVSNRFSKPLLIVSKEAIDEFEEFQIDNLDDYREYDCVVIGLASKEFSYDSLNKAFRVLIHLKEQHISKGRLIAMHAGRYFASKDGQLNLGPGPFVHALQYATDIRPLVIGKPSADFFLSVLNELNVTPDECVMVGDDVVDDVRGAIDVGISGVLVKTGKYRSGDEFRIGKTPTAIYPSIVEFITDFISLNSGNSTV